MEVDLEYWYQQLIKRKEKFPKKRPQTLKADVIHFKIHKEKWLAFVGLFNGKPYEIFTGLKEEINLPDYVKNGEIIKNEDRSYDFVYSKILDYEDENPIGVLHGISQCFNPEYWNCAMLLSKFMRTNPPLEDVISIVNSLHFNDTNCFHNWKKGVIRALVKYIPSGTKSNKDKCNCGENYIYQEGCLLCNNCGDSKCN